MLAEALEAYQETTEEPAQPAAEPENELGRLFDWRYQAPDSGRHRSAE